MTGLPTRARQSGSASEKRRKRRRSVWRKGIRPNSKQVASSHVRLDKEESDIFDRIPAWGSFIIAAITLLGVGTAVYYVVVVPSQAHATTSTVSTSTTATQARSSSLVITESMMTFVYSTYQTSGFGPDFGWWVYDVSAWNSISVNYHSGNCGPPQSAEDPCSISFGSGPCTPTGQNLLLCQGYTYASDCVPQSCTFTAPGQSVEVTKQGTYIAVFGFRPTDNFTIYLSS